MRIKVATALLATVLFMGCQKNTSSSKPEETNEEIAVTKRECASNEVLEQQLASDPAMRQRLNNIEAFTQKAIANKSYLRIAADGVLEIPVIVNVIYRTSSENISAAQIQSQIDVLNEDFNLDNPDHTSVPSTFSGVKADVGIRFVLAGVVRKQSQKKSWNTNDDMKRSSRGGIDPTDPLRNLNMWVVNKITSGGSTILGYAQFPGGDPATDGIVCGHNFFGRTGVVSAPFNKGRTATHEVGHWMNLRHIWGDVTCGNDFVNDTPTHNGPNYGCPAENHRSTCSGNPIEMTMNYMDYTDDACMYMFSNGQKERMLTIFSSGGPRASFAL